MNADDFSPADLDRLQRVGFQPPFPATDGRLTLAPAALRSCLKVTGIGRLEKTPPTGAGTLRPGTDHGAPSGLPLAVEAAPITRDLLVAMYTYQVPLVFEAGCTGDQASFRIGTWLPDHGSEQSAQCNARLLRTALQTLYPAIDLIPDNPVTGRWPQGGLVMGIPTTKPPDTTDGATQFDRLLRALRHLRWNALLLAQPLDEALVRDLKLRLINEMRSVDTATKLGGVPSPLADYYLDMLTWQLKSLTDGQATGTWRTAVYLLGDEHSYPELASLWRGVFSGEHSYPEPVRVWESEDIPQLATTWALVDPLTTEGAPGRYRQPFQHQTLLTSSQLAAYVHFPNLETNGFTVTQVPDMDTVPPSVDGTGLELGTVIERLRPTDTAYRIAPGSLTRHAFITGVTGSGKTNTVLHLLRQAAEQGIPFLVVEPAKTEYRVLLRDMQLGPTLRLYTLGNEMVSPFRLNPFDVPEGIPVAVHLDLLRSVFNVSFGMWTPLPQILEASLHAIYTDRGWNVTTDTNRRLDPHADRSAAFPTLTDLVRKVEEIVPQLGYEDKVTGDLRAALCTRLNSLRTGGKGRMLDARRALPMQALLSEPTILELEGVGDDEDKAFLMGLLMIRLAEQRRVQGDTEGLQHLLVIEEAHRLLANTTNGVRGGAEGEADVRGKAVETFANLLSEIRAYGQGVVVVDQIPTKLAPDVVKNTNLKIVHRIVAGDDRAILGGAMVMTARQTDALATLPVGRAAVFTEGEDAPLLLQVAQTKGGGGTWPTHSQVREHMTRHGITTEAYLLPSGICDQRCLTAPEACETARTLVEDPRVMRTLARVLFSVVQTRGALDRTWPDILAIVEPRRPHWLDTHALLTCLIPHAARQFAETCGARAHWTYTETASVANLIDQALTQHHTGQDATQDATKLRNQLLALQGGTYGPYQSCARIWKGRPGPCLCSHHVAELVAAGDFGELWQRARETDRASHDGSRHAVWEVCQDAAYQLIEFPEANEDPDLQIHLRGIAHCIALCFAQQMLAAEKWPHPATERRALNALLAEAEGSRPSTVQDTHDA
ncbi:ATP-binding protein [Kitasatospora sp. NPDC058190]|uniref:ATP-binding protein n=1 Tax=Kitasatospora sp. NPDC058190 TaxID=3346371 RepID=UPI0036DBB0F7